MKENINLNLTKIPKELQLILEILKRSNFDKTELFTDINWDLFLKLSVHHRVYPMLYRILSSIDCVDQIPKYVIENLREHYRSNTFQMLHLSSVMEQVGKIFTHSQIKILFLKGPTLGYDLYGDISLRTSRDLDVLIPINQLQEAESILLKQGYKKHDYIETVLGDWKWRHHHITFYHPVTGVNLEVHWRLHPGPSSEPSFSELWRRKSKSKLTNSPIYTLGNEDLFAYLVTHGARHGWSRLRWLHDINHLVDKNINWSETFRILNKYQSLHIGGQALTLSSKLFDTDIPREATSLINKKSIKLSNQAIFYLERMINLHTDPVPVEVSRYHKRHLFSLMSKRQKVIFILSFLYPYPEDAETLRLPKSLHILYFALRPFLWMWRKTKEYAIS